MRLTGPATWGDLADRPGAVEVLRTAVSWGVNYIDTADSYGPHSNESLIKDALWPYPRDLVIATKGGCRPHRLPAVRPPTGWQAHPSQAGGPE